MTLFTCLCIPIGWLDARFNENSATIKEDLSRVMYRSDAMLVFPLKFPMLKIVFASIVVVEEVELVLDSVFYRDAHASSIVWTRLSMTWVFTTSSLSSFCFVVKAIPCDAEDIRVGTPSSQSESSGSNVIVVSCSIRRQNSRGVAAS